jgi:hypothetical protein
MTDLEVIDAVRRHMLGIEHELLGDPPCAATQWVWAMGEYTKEMAASFSTPATAPPVNRDVPHLSGTGTVAETLTVTLGNWEGEPTDYSFAWKRDGETVGSNAVTYRVDTADAGHSITCVVTAMNAKGSTAAPPSNAIPVAEPGRVAEPSRSAAPAARR